MGGQRCGARITQRQSGQQGRCVALTACVRYSVLVLKTVLCASGDILLLACLMARTLALYLVLNNYA